MKSKTEKGKDAVILAHYYVDGEVQEIADYVGDSYYLAEIATKVPRARLFSVESLSWEKVRKS